MNRFASHDRPMVEPDFQLDTMNPNDEPFWSIGSPYANEDDGVFLVDRAGAMELIRQLQLGLAKYYEKFPLQSNEMPPDQMRTGGPKEIPHARARQQHDPGDAGPPLQGDADEDPAPRAGDDVG